MKSPPFGLAVLGAGLLAGCTMNGPNDLVVHEALLYGAAQERIVWVYGTLRQGGTNQVRVGGQSLDVAAQVADSFGLPGTLSVAGKSTYRTPTTAGTANVSVARVIGTDTFTVRANTAVESVFFTDGQSWFKLSGQLAAGSVTTVRGQPNTFLRGAGRLTDAEADAIGRSLLGQSALAVAVVPETTVPDARLTLDPAPREYVRTALYVQSGIASALAPTGTAPVPSTPTPPAQGGSVTARVLERGTNSTYSASAPGVFVSRTATDLQSTWRLAGGNLVPAPAVPAVDLTQNTVVTFFLGQRPTGGYGVNFVSSRASGSTVFVTVDVSTPAAGTITTQALTSPWVAVVIPGQFTRAVIQDRSGTVLAQSN